MRRWPMLDARRGRRCCADGRGRAARRPHRAAGRHGGRPRPRARGPVGGAPDGHRRGRPRPARPRHPRRARSRSGSPCWRRSPLSPFGTMVGALAGTIGGKVDAVVMRMTDVVRIPEPPAVRHPAARLVSPRARRRRRGDARDRLDALAVAGADRARRADVAARAAVRRRGGRRRREPLAARAAPLPAAPAAGRRPGVRAHRPARDLPRVGVLVPRARPARAPGIAGQHPQRRAALAARRRLVDRAVPRPGDPRRRDDDRHDRGVLARASAPALALGARAA